MVAPVLTHDPIGYPKAESDPSSFFRRDERLEDALHNCWRDSVSGVGDNDLYAVGTLLRPASGSLHPHTKRSAVRHRVHRVADDVGDDLAHLVAETGCNRSPFTLGVHADALTRQSLPEESKDRVDDIADVGRRRGVRLFMEPESLCGDVRDSPQFLFGGLEIALCIRLERAVL